MTFRFPMTFRWCRHCPQKRKRCIRKRHGCMPFVHSALNSLLQEIVLFGRNTVSEVLDKHIIRSFFLLQKYLQLRCFRLLPQDRNVANAGFSNRGEPKGGGHPDPKSDEEQADSTPRIFPLNHILPNMSSLSSSLSSSFHSFPLQATLFLRLRLRFSAPRRGPRVRRRQQHEEPTGVARSPKATP